MRKVGCGLVSGCRTVGPFCHSRKNLDDSSEADCDTGTPRLVGEK
jgi:hypothetical protein